MTLYRVEPTSWNSVLRVCKKWKGLMDFLYKDSYLSSMLTNVWEGVSLSSNTKSRGPSTWSCIGGEKVCSSPQNHIVELHFVKGTISGKGKNESTGNCWEVEGRRIFPTA
jgi:hypothetical protein